MKIDPESIVPRIFSVHCHDGWHHLLACSRRIFKSGKTDQPGEGKVLTVKGSEWQPLESWDHVLFPVMVELPINGSGIADDVGVLIHFGVSGNDRRWTVSPPSLLRISDHAAKHTICEAWRGVVDSKVSAETLLPWHRFDTGPLVDYKGGTALWMINAWVRWDAWNRNGYSYPQRAEQLEKLGFKVKPKDIKNAAGVRGLPRELKE